MPQYKLKIIDNDIKKILNNKFFNKLKNKSVLITGGSGLIGSYLLRTLVLLKKKGIKIRITTIINKKKEKIFDCLCDRQVTVIKTDLSKKFEKKLKYYDMIIHAAGYGQPNKFIQIPEKTTLINTVGTLKLLKKLKKKGKFLFLSTSELYSGNSKTNNEKTIGNINTNHPRSAYVHSKILGETICNFFKKNNIKTYCARVSLAYGPGNKKNDNRVLYEFIAQALKKNKIIIKSGSRNIRTYCYILDTTEILFKILLLGKQQIYNVGGVSTLNILSLAKKIKKKLKNENIKIIIKKKKDMAPSFVKININLIKKEFNKKKFINFDHGLTKTIEWQKIILNKQ